MGHQVKLIHPRYVRPYRRCNKVDRNDCDSMLEAMHYKNIHPVPVKSMSSNSYSNCTGCTKPGERAVPSEPTCYAVFCARRVSKRLLLPQRLSVSPMN